MKNYLRTVFYLGLLVLTCSNAHGGTSQNIYIDGNTLYYNSELSAEHIDNAIKMSDKANVTTLVIDSNGGYATPAMKFGRWINKNEINVVVSEVCFSSCANYIVTASPNVIVKKGAILGWHGGALQEHWKYPEDMTDEEKSQWNEYLNSWRSEEAEFFQEIGVQQKITVYGWLNNAKKMNEYDCQGENVLGWTYPIETMKRLGLKNIRFEDSNPKIKNHHGTKVLCLIDVLDNEV